ncbi:MAG: hypothetical protein OXC71_10050 [Chloroflexi bacterium]|nr:hypothetical protein [Chloroflexota bacterium]
MGTFNVTIEVAGGPDGPFEAVEALAGNGQLYSSMPASLLRRLGVEPTDRRTFVTADGRSAERDIGWPAVRLGGHERARPTLVVFAGDDDAILLGNLTLTMVGLEVDPERAELVPLTAYLPGIRLESGS